MKIEDLFAVINQIAKQQRISDASEIIDVSDSLSDWVPENRKTTTLAIVIPVDTVTT